MNQVSAAALLSVYNPASLTPAALKQNFIVRTEVLDALLAVLHSESERSVATHQLVIGQRGMGKTTLLHRLALAIREDVALKQRWLPLTFPEEQYNIAGLAEFWRNCLDALIDALEAEGLPVEELDRQQAALTPRDADAALRLFRTAASSLKRRPLLLVDNLDLVFQRISKAEAWALRAVLQEPGGAMVVGSAVLPLEDSFDYGQAFYDFLHPRWLDRLDFGEALRLMMRLAKDQQRDDMTRELARNPARLVPLHLFSGGNIRTLVLLFRVLANGLNHDVQQDIEAALDLSTPLYKARLEALPTQQQIVFVAVALAFDPITAADLAKQLDMGVNQISAQLNKLVQAGLLRKGPSGASKRLTFEVAERFFGIWYLMRANRRERSRMLWLARFLRDWYANDEAALAEAANDLLKKDGGVASAHTAMLMTDGLASAAHVRKAAMQRLSPSDQRDYAWSEIVKHPRALGKAKQSKSEKAFSERLHSYFDWALPVLRDIHANLDVLETRHHARNAITALLRDPERCLRVLEAQPASALRELGRGWALTAIPARHDEAETAFRQVLVQEPENSNAWNGLGGITMRSQRFEEAETALQQSIRTDARNPIPWTNLGVMYHNHLARYADAEAAYLHAIKLDGQFAEPWYALGVLYQAHLKRYDAAEHAYRQAITLTDDFAMAWFNLAALLHGDLHRYDDAEAAYRQAIRLDANDLDSLHMLGLLLAHHLARPQEAEGIIRQALEIDSVNATIWNSLGGILEGHLRRDDESEAAYRKAISLNPDYAHPWHNLGNLYAKRAQYTQAEIAYREAVRLDDRLSASWNNLGNIFTTYGDRHPEAETSYVMAIQTDASYVDFWNNLCLLWRSQPHLLGALSAERLRTLMNAVGALDEVPSGFEELLKVLLDAGKLVEVCEAITGTALALKAQPLVEALRALHRDAPVHLTTLAAEVREASYRVLTRLAPDFAARIARELPALVTSLSLPDRDSVRALRSEP